MKMMGKKSLFSLLLLSCFCLMLLLFSCILFSGCADEAKVTKVEEQEVTPEEAEPEPEVEEELEPEVVTEEEPIVEEKPYEPTLGEKNALSMALDYLDYTAFSYSGLVEQLEYEEFTHEEAVYAADNCRADWYEQAALMAESYLDYSSFSRDGLIEQLEYEGFTHEQAEYGVQAVGY
jgi:colicin import membrane protein